jgi:hypothetical protein
MRHLGVFFMAAVLFGALPATAGGGEVTEGYEEVVFRVTLQGPVDPSHTFGVERQCAEEICVTEDIVIVCSPPNETYDWPTCSATAYEFTSQIRAGLTVEYALLRWTTPDLHHTGDQPEERLHGSWVVQEGRQVISLGYVYPSAATPSQPTGGAALPDTAIEPPHGSVLLGLALVVASLLALHRATRRHGRNPTLR